MEGWHAGSSVGKVAVLTHGGKKDMTKVIVMSSWTVTLLHHMKNKMEMI